MFCQGSWKTGFGKVMVADGSPCVEPALQMGRPGPDQDLPVPYACPQDNWLQLVCGPIQQRIAQYAANEIRFNLMAVIGDRQEILSQQLSEARLRQQAAQARLSQLRGSDGGGAAAMEVDSGAAAAAAEGLPEDPELLQQVVVEAEARIAG
jgi:hypothetical protein